MFRYKAVPVWESVPSYLKSLTEPAFRMNERPDRPALNYASVSIILSVDYANNVPVNKYKSWLFLIIFQT